VGGGGELTGAEVGGGRRWVIDRWRPRWLEKEDVSEEVNPGPAH
jgi:hypothetical protein